MTFRIRVLFPVSLEKSNSIGVKHDSTESFHHKQHALTLETSCATIS
jgi:hypothetical protein